MGRDLFQNAAKAELFQVRLHRRRFRPRERKHRKIIRQIRHVASDRCKLIAHPRLLCVSLQIFAQLRPARFVRVSERVFQLSEFGKQLERRLFADLRHAGNVVRRVAHQTFQIDDARRLDPVSVEKLLPVEHVDLADPLARHPDARMFADELEAVAVARDEDRVDALRLAIGGIGPEKVVGLVSRRFDARRAEVVQNVF